MIPVRSSVPVAASTLLTTLLTGAPGPRSATAPLRQVHRTRMSVHYETGRDDVPLLCVALPEAVRLPASLLTATLPDGPVDLDRWQVTRWWQPPRPSGLVPPARTHHDGSSEEQPAVLDPAALVGAGEGLTPAGDDLLAAALVTARATGDPRLPRWCAATEVALATRRTTAVSRALLHHALEGWCVPELAGYLEAACSGHGLPAATARLLALGHSSGAALRAGVHLVLDSRAVAAPGGAA
ncbi:DUF2877 domain-containing protein [Nocardioides mesophilus]|uniref:DUF2877 domain-containing protein n=1 Tax=Nocardioides mesophilus TaxID=433659 RepID=A0A7G9RAF3_9ACTN|nr:DUF2877 domain-containing protein [Nocardioides mesophilus]QNN52578.1 DUF2877 domain-containing protein [Nocardioides mesophilus]